MAQTKADRTWAVYPQVNPLATREVLDDGRTALGFPSEPGMTAGEARQLSDARWWDVLGTPPLPFSLSVRIGVASDGRFTCTGVRIASESEVTARDLRLVKLPDIVARAAKAAYAGASGSFSYGYLGYEVLPSSPKPRARAGRPEYERDYFDGLGIREVYQEALREQPRRPALYVAAKLHTSEPTARRWIKRAAQLGVITLSAKRKDG